ncbi:hypothetical protein [Haloferula sp.]|uniref:hypothetical protein n=1 Tax=Haloferula sp. TaxID=2497595 RepID=UPI003C719729
MIQDLSRSFDSTHSTLDLSQLEHASEPLHRVLSDLIAGCSSESGTSTMTTAGLVLSLCQLRGRAMSEHVPSLIFLNAGEAAPDPVDEFVKDFVHDEEANNPGENGYTAGIPIKPEHAPAIMERAIRERRDLGYRRELDPLSERNAQAHENAYREASKSAHGTGGARAYSRAWAKGFGLLTDKDDQVILRLNEAPDRAAFRHDVLKDPGRLLMPEGVGQHLLMARKTVTVSGSLTVDLWDEELVTGIIKLGLPVVFLPHTGKEPLTIPNAAAMKVLPGLWRDVPAPCARTSLRLPPINWFVAHTKDVRQRLHLLPGDGAYEFAIQQLLHQLGSACDQIAQYSGNNHETTPEQISALYWDLHARSFRGITLGMAALAWHCLGFDTGCPREKALKVLSYIREKGSVKKSDLLLAKGSRVDAATRDILLERLAAEDLIRVEGKTVTATSFEDFVMALHSRPALPDSASFRSCLRMTENSPSEQGLGKS